MKAKRRKPVPTTRLSVQYLEALGYLVQVVESRIPHTFITRDAFGILDLIAVRRDEILGVQVTGDNSGDVARRVRKITDHENTPRLRESGMRLVVHGWKRTKTGPKLREIDLS